jgi:glycosyltransferase involved in cell wall biosynthesis
MLYKETDNIIVKMLKMLKFLLNYKPDYLIQRGLTVESCFLAIVCKLLQVKMIFMFAHDREVNGKLQRNGEKVFFIRLLLNNATFLITQNEFQRENLLKNYKKNSIIIYSGYPINEYIDYKSYLDKKKYILWVSRGEKWKQAELFLELALKNSSIKFLMIFSKNTDEVYIIKLKIKLYKYKL